MDADSNDGSCTYASFPYDCSNECLNDADGDGVCDSDETVGCTILWPAMEGFSRTPTILNVFMPMRLVNSVLQEKWSFLMRTEMACATEMKR